METNSVVVIGAGGHAKVVIELLHASGYRVDFCVSGAAGESGECLGVPTLGGDERLLELYRLGYRLACPAVGNNGVRAKIANLAVQAGYSLVNAVSPNALISPSARLGLGVAVMAGAVINANANIADLCIINTSSSVDHDCRVGYAVHIAPSCALAGCVEVGDRAFLGVGASVIPNIKIGADSVVGAGSVVIRDVPIGACMAGNPARHIQKKVRIS